MTPLHHDTVKLWHMYTILTWHNYSINYTVVQWHRYTVIPLKLNTVTLLHHSTVTPRRAQSPLILCFTERQFVDTIIESAFIKLENVQNTGGGRRREKWQMESNIEVLARFYCSQSCKINPVWFSGLSPLFIVGLVLSSSS